MEKSIQFQDHKISYSVNGNGPALVLLHGFLESKAIFETFTGELKHKFTALAIDLPGHGESDLLAERHSMQLMADAVKAVLTNENIHEIVLLGHSMGGYVALQLAAESKISVKGLVLFHSHAAADSEPTKVNRQRTIEIVKKNRGGFISQFIPDLFDQRFVGNYSSAISQLQSLALGMSAEGISAALAGMRDREDRTAFLASTDIPVLFIIGKQDSRMPFMQLLEQASLPAHSEIVLLDKVGHMGFIEAPGVTFLAIKHFALRCFER